MAAPTIRFMAGLRECSQAVLRGSRPAAPLSARMAIIIPMAQMQQQGEAAGLEIPVDRRAALGLFAAWIVGGASAGIAHSEGKIANHREPKPSPGNPYGDEENGLWLPGLLPIPTVTNKINNPETGTRSFVQLGVYVANIGPEGSAYRIKHNAFDLLGWGDLLGKNAWSPLKKYLQLKSTIMYYDFDTVITGASEEQKQPLTDLANRLFSSFEKLEEAVKMKDDSGTRWRYDETKVVLKEVMERMAGA
uniref:Photosynthetic NDH subcomplex L 3 n=1 Tax=Habenaria pantlingiana TaxID=1498489 RepID=A0A0F7CYI9_9ASPA